MKFTRHIRIAGIALIAPLVAIAEPTDSLRVNSAPSMLLHRQFDPVDVLLDYQLAPTTSVTSPLAEFSTMLVSRQLTRLESTLFGADRMAHTGLALGAAGSWLGLWEEETAWKLMGAGAAAGALLGGIGGDNVMIRVRPSSDDDRFEE